jgi:hypothetical protein
MIEKYYQVTEKNKEVKHGLILKLSLGELEFVAGEDWDKDKNKLLEKMNISHDNLNILSISEGYKFTEIAHGEANSLIHDWNYFLECVMEGGYNPKTPWRDM